MKPRGGLAKTVVRLSKAEFGTVFLFYGTLIPFPLPLATG